MSAPMYNALAAKSVLTSQPVPKPVAAPPAKAAKHAPQPAAGFNAKPNKDANAGQSPAMVGDRQKIARPAAVTLPSTAQARPAEQRSGLEAAMGAAADQLHPVRRR